MSDSPCRNCESARRNASCWPSAKKAGARGSPCSHPQPGVCRGGTRRRPTIGIHTSGRKKSVQTVRVRAATSHNFCRNAAREMQSYALRPSARSRADSASTPARVRSANWYGLVAWLKTGAHAAANVRETSRRNMSPVECRVRLHRACESLSCELKRGLPRFEAGG